MRWLRLYDDTINDPKILKLPEAMRWHWVAFLCVASKNQGDLPPLDDIAIQLRVTTGKATEIIGVLVKAGLLDKTETGFAPHNWNGRQYKSDVSTERVKRFRNAKRNVSETPPDTETDTDTEKHSLRECSAPAKRGTRLPEDWVPSVEDWREATAKLGEQGSVFELSKFRDHWKAQPGQRGVKLDWNATFRNWIRNARGPANGQRSANSRTTGHDAILAAATRAARKIPGDSEMAGSAGEAEFPFGDGSFGGRAQGNRGTSGRTAAGDDRGKPGAGTVFEGEIIAPDKDAAGLSHGWRRH
jgi:hypothetical protein